MAHIAAALRPSAFAGLFLTNAIGYDSWPIPSVVAMRAAGGVVRHLPNALFKAVFSSFIGRGHDSLERARESVDSHWPHYASQGGAAAFIRQVRSLDVNDTAAVADELPRLNVPARVAWGVSDQFQKIEYGERFARDLKAPLVRIEGGRHFTPEDHPEVIAREVNLLLDQSRSQLRPSASSTR